MVKRHETLHHKSRVLLVDDDLRNLIALRALLSDFDIEVVEAGDVDVETGG